MSDLTLALTGVAGTGTANNLGAPVSGAVGVTLRAPALLLQGVGLVRAIAVTLPAPAIATSGVNGAIGTVTVTLPAPVVSIHAPTTLAVTLPAPLLSITAKAGVIGSVGITLPAPALNIVSPDSVNFALPTPQLSITGEVGAVGSVTFNLPALVPSLSGTVPNAGVVGVPLPAPSLVISGSAGVVGSVNVTLARLALAIQGASGVIGSASVTLPAIQLGAGGYVNVIGQVNVTLPHLQLVATGARPNVPSSPTALNTIAMHTEQMGLTAYSNYPFNSFAAFNGVYLGACDAGLFLLSGDTDNGALIQAAVRVGVTDFSTSFLKRVDRIYVGYRTTGDLVLRVITDETEVRDYRLPATGKAGLHGNHTRLGKGLTARYWQFELRNQHGEHFELNTIELKPTVLKRRVGGRDA